MVLAGVSVATEQRRGALRSSDAGRAFVARLWELGRSTAGQWDGGVAESAWVNASWGISLLLLITVYQSEILSSLVVGDSRLPFTGTRDLAPLIRSVARFVVCSFQRCGGGLPLRSGRMRLVASTHLGAYGANVVRFAKGNSGWRAMREAIEIHPHRRLGLPLAEAIAIVAADPSLVYPVTRGKYQVMFMPALSSALC